MDLSSCAFVQVAWNKAELSGHGLEPEQQERLFSGKGGLCTPQAAVPSDLGALQPRLHHSTITSRIAAVQTYTRLFATRALRLGLSLDTKLTHSAFAIIPHTLMLDEEALFCCRSGSRRCHPQSQTHRLCCCCCCAEIRVLKTLKHRNIITCYDWWHDARSQTINFITEYFTSGTLRQ